MSDLSTLSLLDTAPSKGAIDRAINMTFAARNEVETDSTLDAFCNVLNIENRDQGKELQESLLKCIKVSLACGNLSNLGELFEVEAAAVDKKILKLIGQIINSHLQVWREASSLNRVSLPRLVDIDWALHLKTSSSSSQKLNIPTVLMQLSIEENCLNIKEMPLMKKVDFELSKEALETVLDGLRKIKDQLSLM